jgi:hypothetical protein
MILVWFEYAVGCLSFHGCWVSGYSEEVVAARDWWRCRFISTADFVPEEPPCKEFKPKFPMLPVLKDYKDIDSQEFWDRFPVNFIQPAKSNISAVRLRELLVGAGIEMGLEEEKVIGWLAGGASIGCEGECRAASVSKNTKGAYANGPQVSDAIASWVKQGYAFGPVEEEEVPAGAKINSILTRAKPNGAVRIILNLSAPKGLSVNDGIDIEQFPASMSSTEAWVAVLNKVGRGALMTKIDFADAYKHVPVVQEDTDLQWFEWGGKYFKELCLIFGCSSSAGIFYATAKLVLRLVCRLANFPRDQVAQHLDDICAAAGPHSGLVERFDSVFQQVAGLVGVKLASRDDPDKSFGPGTCGIVFGVQYDTVSWTWSIPQEKRVRIMLAIQHCLEQDQVTAREAKSLVGKLIHIRALLPAAKFNMSHIMRLNAVANDLDLDGVLVDVQPECKRQLAFWLMLLKACPGWMGIPAPCKPMPWAIQVYTDAAGGSLERVGAGTGGVAQDWWFYVPWPKRVNAGGWRVDGKKVGRKLSALELVGPLVALAAGHRRLAGRHVTMWVDNAGSVAIWNKGYSTRCRLASTAVTAISAVAAALGCTLHILKIRRCSDVGSEIADALSKADFQRARDTAQLNGWQLQLEPERVPVSLLRWIDKPVPDDDLADRILKELARAGPILNYSV